MRWTTELRKEAFGKVLRQDMRWFDGDGGGDGAKRRAPAALAQVIVRDGDDARI